MKCEVTGCGDSADHTLNISLRAKDGKDRFNHNNMTRTVSVCARHHAQIIKGDVKVKP